MLVPAINKNKICNAAPIEKGIACRMFKVLYINNNNDDNTVFHLTHTK